MKPITFPEVNVVFAKDQPEYLPLPAYQEPEDPKGRIITRWELSEAELNQIRETKSIYISVYTFNNPLQPILPYVGLSSFPDPVEEEETFHTVEDNSIGFRKYLDTIGVDYKPSGHQTLISTRYQLGLILAGLEDYKLANP